MLLLDYRRCMPTWKSFRPVLASTPNFSFDTTHWENPILLCYAITSFKSTYSRSKWHFIIEHVTHHDSSNELYIVLNYLCLCYIPKLFCCLIKKNFVLLKGSHVLSSVKLSTEFTDTSFSWSGIIFCGIHRR